MLGWFSLEAVRASRSRRARAVGVLEALRGQNLQGDVPVELFVVGAVDLPHSSGTELGDDPEVSQLTSDH